jgi:hypothetical protein
MTPLMTQIVIAYHEAGHAAIFLDRRFKFETVEIGDNPSVKCPAGQRRPYLVRAVTSAGGPIAEARYSRKSLKSVFETHGADDFRMCQEALAELRDDNEQLLKAVALFNGEPEIEHVVGLARRVVTRQWPFICKLAASLLIHRRLTYGETLKLLGWTSYFGTP